MRYIALDIETGGIGTDYSLLTAYFEVLDKSFNSQGSLYLQIKSDIYNVSAEALKINKIDLIKHDAGAVSKSEAGRQLRDFLISQSTEKLIPIGHGIHGDLNFIWQHLLNKKEFEKYVSYGGRLDTGVIAQFLKVKGLIPESVHGSLEALIKFYDIKTDGELHTAFADTKMTIEVLKHELGMF